MSSAKRHFEDTANSFVHNKRHACPVCGAEFTLPTIMQNTTYRCSCGTRVTVAPEMWRQRIMDWTDS
jgi:ribosomal protein S27AE